MTKDSLRSLHSSVKDMVTGGLEDKVQKEVETYLRYVGKGHFSKDA